MLYFSRIVLSIAVVLHASVFCSSTAKASSSRRDFYHGEIFQPTNLALGTTPSTQLQKFRSFQLEPSAPVATLEYRFEVAGYPVFDVESFTGKVQIEVKYGEEFLALKSNFSDGPFPYAVTLANTYRVETFEVTERGRFEAFLLQGGQKWQSIRLLTPGSITFSTVGFKPSIPVVDINQLPGNFDCDNENLNEIWKLGARAASLACFEQGSQKTIWEVDDNGAFIRGMRSGLSARGAFWEDYTLEFDARIERGGIGWTVAHPLASPSRGIQLNLVGCLPNETTFVNTNTSLTPANSILLGYGYSFVNVTTLTSYYLDTFKTPLPIREKTWYKIKTVLSGGQHLAVSIDDTQVFNTSLKEYYVSYPGYGLISTQGSFGFGGWQDQAGTIKNVVAYDSNNKTSLYSNSMTDASQVIAEYGVHENYASVCLDGPKRDRLVWLGDFYHTTRIIGASTSRFDIAKGTLNFLLDWQIPSGLLPYDPPIGYNSSVASAPFSVGGGPLAGYEVASIILPDYQILGLLSFANYVYQSRDLDFARQTWSKWQLQINWILSQIKPATGLLSLVGAFLGPANGGSAINCALVQALHMAADVATSISDIKSASQYRATATSLAAAINQLLWNDTLGIYSLSPTATNEYSVNSIAFCITSGTANATQASRFISKLPSLRLGPGYRDSTQVNASDPSSNISPNTNGFLLSALLSQNSTSTANTSLQLLRSLWNPMLTNPETTTGASWEYVDLSGNPGLGLFTSLSHPWGGAPTYLLTEWFAGLQAAKGVEGFGYGKWVINPSVGVANGLKNASARVVTAFDGFLEVQWRITNGTTMVVSVKAPRRTSGVFEMGTTRKVLSGSDVYQFTIKIDKE
ncbi:Six-hairpin glycosidase-like protein [Bisporella sp. PMI_857]|nr:Six-hairpin glycosidase-like protein [Bisporella sp. PMI_857]